MRSKWIAVLLGAVLFPLHVPAAFGERLLDVETPTVKVPAREITSSKEALFEFIKIVAPKYNIPPLLMMAIAQGESRLNIWAVTVDDKKFLPKSKDEALEILKLNADKPYQLGIMQINDKWLRTFNMDDAEAIEPNVNMHLAAYILNEYFVAYGAKWEALAAYRTEDISSPKAVSYAKRVWAYYRRLIEDERKKKQ